MPPITIASDPIEFAAALAKDSNLNLPEGWWNWDNAKMAHRLLARRFLEQLGPFPIENRLGRGIVICAGGHRLFTNAWVCVRMLRHLGCDLPIEFWHLDGEMDEYMADLVAAYQVRCVNARELARNLDPQPRILNGWELKAFAMMRSAFTEILLLDADNVPVVNPEFLFHGEPYQSTGSVFWPDFGRMEASRGMWWVAEVDHRDEPEFESGQILLDKRRCWNALSLAMHYNEHSDFYYHHVHGDKCTFRFAWHRTATPFAMPPYPIHALHATMCQHDFQGRRIFQHRNMDKWRLDGLNNPIQDFWLEKECRGFLRDLRAVWVGVPFQEPDHSAEATHFRECLAGRAILYRRVEYDERRLILNPDGTIGEGSAACERYWMMTRARNRPAMTIGGDHGPICQFLLDPDGRWRGRWLKFEQMPVEMILETATVSLPSGLGGMPLAG